MTALKNKQTRSIKEFYFSSLDDIVADGLGTLAGGILTITTTAIYYQTQSIFTAIRVVVPNEISVAIRTASPGISYTYFGGFGRAIECQGEGTFSLLNIILVAPGATGIFLDNGRVGRVAGSFITTVDVGIEANCDIFVMTSSAIVSYTTAGILSGDRSDAAQRTSISSDLSLIGPGSAGGGTALSFSGNIRTINLSSRNAITVIPTETAFHFDQTLKDNNAKFIVATVNLDNFGGSIFSPTSLTQSYINSTFFGNVGIQDSTSIAKIQFTGNTAQTTNPGMGVESPITLDVTATINTTQRFLLQDEGTFDNTTNTVTTFTGNGLSENDRIFLKNYPGSSLPAELSDAIEYYAINVTASSFQLSLTESGSAIDFTDDGSGTLFYRHAKGETILIHAIYVGAEPIELVTGGWCALSNEDNTDVDYKVIVMKINLDGTIVVEQEGSRANGDNTKPQSSMMPDIIEITTGEGITPYIRQDTNAGDNLIAEELLLILNKT